MKIIGLYPEYFGKFQKKEVRFSDGLNVIYGENEAGKTTLAAFLRAMLFGMEKPRGRAAKQDLYTRYQPLDAPGAYQGAMELEIGGEAYRIERIFYQNERKLRLTNLATGREIPARWEVMEQLLPELSESGFLNTVSVPQTGAATDAALAEELQNYMANLSAAREQEVDVPGALAKLSEQAKQLEAKKLPQQIAELEQALSKQETQMLLLDTRAKERREAQRQLAELERELAESEAAADESRDAEFSVMYERFLAYRSDLREHEDRERELAAKERELAGREQELSGAEPGGSEEAARRLEAYREKKRKLAERAEEYRREDERRAQACENAKASVRQGFWLLLCGAVGLLAAALVLLFLLPLAAGAALLGSIGLTVFAFWRKQKRKALAERLSEERMEAKARASEELLALQKELAEEPSEEEQSERIARLREGLAVVRSRREALAEERERERRAEEALHLQKKGLLAYFRRFSPITELTEPAVGAIQGRLLAESSNREQRAKELSAEARRLQTEIARLEGVLEQGAEIETRCLENRTRLCELQSRLAEDAQEKQAIALAQNTLKKLSEEIHDSFGRELNKTASAYVQKLTNGAYRKVTLDEKLKLKIDTGSRYLQSSQCSAGTLEQLYLAVRLAVGETMYRGEPLPLIFDDAFAFYDDERLIEALRLLADCGRQVLLFTCQKREAELLAKNGLAFSPVML